jgi:V8-like Glu-specific endopeptidase
LSFERKGSSLRLSKSRLTISAVAIAATTATAGVAVALNAPGQSADVGTASAPRINPAAADSAVVAQSEAEVLKYWTPARIAAAEKQGAPKAPVRTGTSLDAAQSATVQGGSELRVAPADPSGASAGTSDVNTSAIQARRVTNYSKAPGRTTGKVFFTLRGQQYVCSASVVVAANKSTVWTAGHCLNDPGRAWASYVLFRPAYRNGASQGRWVARRLFSSQGWTRQGNPGYDVGAFVVRRQNGRGVQHRVGAQGIWFGAKGLKHFVRAHGYPARTNKGAPMNGQVQWWCSSSTWGFKFSGFPNTWNRGMRCTMGPGSSGGPWLARINSNGYGYILGNVSHGVNNGAYVSSPYIGAAAKRVWNAARVA